MQCRALVAYRDSIDVGFMASECLFAASISYIPQLKNDQTLILTDQIRSVSDLGH